MSIILPLDPIYSSQECINYSTNGHIKFLIVPHYAVVFKTACRRPDIPPPTSQNSQEHIENVLCHAADKRNNVGSMMSMERLCSENEGGGKHSGGDSLISHTATLTLSKLGVHCRLEPHRD